MVRLPEGYCIDSTEVTRAQYQIWLDSNPSTAKQVSLCVKNTTFTPEAICKSRAAWCDSDCDNHPQVCVDWCDAYAYCKSVGKRLCGKIGGGPNAFDNYAWADASLSQWYNACTSHGKNATGYPYGPTYQAQACNGIEYSGYRRTVPVGTLDGCQSPISEYAGVFDLSGNVSEWEDACDDRAGVSHVSCQVRGGDFLLGADGLVCTGGGGLTDRDSQHWSIGFRCCS